MTPAPALAALLVAAAAGCGGGAEASQPSVTVGDVAPIDVEVADTADERAVGLMGRAEVPPGTGMVFVYPEPVSNQFWMGNVEVPLSIAWVLDDTVVGLAEMQPCPAADETCPRYSPGDPVHARRRDDRGHVHRRPGAGRRHRHDERSGRGRQPPVRRAQPASTRSSVAVSDTRMCRAPAGP